MNQPISRLRAAHAVGKGWTVDDAAELYEIARWGKGYFSIGENGQVRIHPTKDTNRSINLKRWSTICSFAASVCRRSSGFGTSCSTD